MRRSLLLLSVAALAAACDDHPAANRKDEAPITKPTAESAPSGPASKGPTGPPELSEESAFDSNQWNSAVGLSGGAGGRYGGRGGAVRMRRAASATESYAEVPPGQFYLAATAPLSVRNSTTVRSTQRTSTGASPSSSDHSTG